MISGSVIIICSWRLAGPEHINVSEKKQHFHRPFAGYTWKHNNSTYELMQGWEEFFFATKHVVTEVSKERTNCFWYKTWILWYFDIFCTTHPNFGLLLHSENEVPVKILLTHHWRSSSGRCQHDLEIKSYRKSSQSTWKVRIAK